MPHINRSKNRRRRELRKKKNCVTTTPTPTTKNKSKPDDDHSDDHAHTHHPSSPPPHPLHQQQESEKEKEEEEDPDLYFPNEGDSLETKRRKFAKLSDLFSASIIKENADGTRWSSWKEALEKESLNLYVNLLPRVWVYHGIPFRPTINSTFQSWPLRTLPQLSQEYVEKTFGHIHGLADVEEHKQALLGLFEGEIVIEKAIKVTNSVEVVPFYHHHHGACEMSWGFLPSTKQVCFFEQAAEEEEKGESKSKARLMIVADSLAEFFARCRIETCVWRAVVPFIGIHPDALHCQKRLGVGRGGGEGEVQYTYTDPEGLLRLISTQLEQKDANFVLNPSSSSSSHFSSSSEEKEEGGGGGLSPQKEAEAEKEEPMPLELKEAKHYLIYTFAHMVTEIIVRGRNKYVL